jgi:hypothetical protein
MPAIVNVVPKYVIDRNEIVSDAANLAKGGNALVLGIVSGIRAPAARPLVVTDIRDVAGSVRKIWMK